MGRVKVDVRGVQSGPGSGGWALVCLPAAAGHFAKVQTGATVIVAFEGGDPAYPIVLGRVASVGAAASPSPR
jgi:uncharacterized protein involved in type VI secretion and phage assembly